MREPQADSPMIHVAEYIPVRSYGRVLEVMRLSMKIYAHARRCEGFVAGGLRTKWWRKQFWSYTVWEDHERLLHFVHTQPHANAVARLLEFAAPGACYTEWVSEAPPDWDEARERLKRPTRYMVPLWP